MHKEGSPSLVPPCLSSLMQRTLKPWKVVAPQTGKSLAPEALVKESWLPARNTPSGLLCGQEISSVKSLECFRATSDFSVRKLIYLSSALQILYLIITVVNTLLLFKHLK